MHLIPFGMVISALGKAEVQVEVVAQCRAVNAVLLTFFGHRATLTLVAVFAVAIFALRSSAVLASWHLVKAILGLILTTLGTLTLHSLFFSLWRSYGTF